MHTISPLDADEIPRPRATPATVLTVEEHNITGGLGVGRRRGAGRRAACQRASSRLGVPDEHVILGPPAALYAHYQLDAAGIESSAP